MTFEELADYIAEQAVLHHTEARIAARTALTEIAESLFEIVDTLPVNDYDSFDDLIEGLSEKFKSLADA